MFHSQPQSLALAARKFAMQEWDDDKRGDRVPDKACPIISRPIIRISKIPGSAEKAQCRESRTGRLLGTCAQMFIVMIIVDLDRERPRRYLIGWRLSRRLRLIYNDYEEPADWNCMR
ncbi:hypothetical protein E5D57_005092 [Metarhizium anisopliae]|nr:hypothetical protein E5D57_005092 [Metarhizium anisopliae]